MGKVLEFRKTPDRVPGEPAPQAMKKLHDDYNVLSVSKTLKTIVWICRLVSHDEHNSIAELVNHEVHGELWLKQFCSHVVSASMVHSHEVMVHRIGYQAIENWFRALSAIEDDVDVRLAEWLCLFCPDGL